MFVCQGKYVVWSLIRVSPLFNAITWFSFRISFCYCLLAFLSHFLLKVFIVFHFICIINGVRYFKLLF